MRASISVLIADDHAVVREGLRAVLGTEDDLRVAGEAADGEEAIHLTRELEPDVLLLDLLMPRRDGLEVVAALKNDGSPTRVLILTSFSDDDKVIRALKLGARGFLLKESSPRELVEAIRAVHHGRSVLAPAITDVVLERLHGDGQPPEEALTEREEEVLILIARGLANQEIADDLGISERTVRTHVGHVLAKLRLSNRTQAALYAIREGLVSP